MDYTRLEMTFNTARGSKTTISVYDPMETLTGTDVNTAMNEILATDIFSSTTGNLVSVNGARIVTRDITELNVG